MDGRKTLAAKCNINLQGNSEVCWSKVLGNHSSPRKCCVCGPTTGSIFMNEHSAEAQWMKRRSWPDVQKSWDNKGSTGGDCALPPANPAAGSASSKGLPSVCTPTELHLRMQRGQAITSSKTQPEVETASILVVAHGAHWTARNPRSCWGIQNVSNSALETRPKYKTSEVCRAFFIKSCFRNTRFAEVRNFYAQLPSESGFIQYLNNSKSSSGSRD